MTRTSSALVSFASIFARSVRSAADRSPRLRLGSLLVAVTLPLAFTGLGCADEACFQWTVGEGACPLQGEALAFFEDPSCPGTGDIESVDSEGAFDDDACCYTVTKRDRSFVGGCFAGGPVGSGVTTVGVSTVSSTSGGGFTGAGGSSGVGGAGGAGGGAACTRCAEAITVGASANLCPSSLELFNQLTDCMCNGVCSASCAPECAGASPTSMVCQQCLTDVMMGCGTQLDLCANDI